MASPQPASHPWHKELPRLGSEEEFAALRRIFRESEYSTEGLKRHFNVGKLEEYKTPPIDVRESQPVERPIDALIRLFLDAVYVEEAALARALPGEAVAALWSLNLLARSPQRAGQCYSNFSIPPAGGVLTTMDRAAGPDGAICALPADVVYPAVVENTRDFVAGLPDTPCEALLDIGTGTGIAALEGARYARHCWGTDIIARPVRFAEFNRRLNGLGNMTTLLGDLYEPVEGLTFDRIVTHPPYVPARKTGLVFRDGGEDGEQIIRRVVEGLPRFLRPGGRMYSLHMASDRTGEPYEQRIRKWLGSQQAEFDVVVVTLQIHEPKDFLGRQLNVIKRDPGEVGFWMEMWEANKTEFLVYSWVLVRRHDGSRPPVTARAHAGEEYRPRHREWLLDFESDAAAAGGTAMLLAGRPVLSPHCELVVLNRVRDGRFNAEEFQTRTHRPFDNSARIEGWVAELIAECDGTRTGQEHFDRRVAQGVLPADASAAEFAGVLRWLISNGILRLPDRPLD
jgi:SAM-dependent methyltransferase